MKDDVKIELLKISAQLAVATVQNKAAFGPIMQCVNTKDTFEKCVSLVKEQYVALDKP